MSHHEILINSNKQQLSLLENDNLLKEYPISTALNGLGELENTFKTPRGLHKVVEIINPGHEFGIKVFKARQVIGTYGLDIKENTKELITGAILRLKGLNKNLNVGKDANNRVIDTYLRYIYIHGTNFEDMVGQQSSIGCIRMRNQDVIELANLINTDALVFIF